MTMEEESTRTGSSFEQKVARLWNIFDNPQGDKVVWLIVILLILISILTLSSSTSQLVGAKGSRISYAMEQGILSVIGFALIFGIYKIKKIGWFWYFSRFGFAISAFLLGWVALRIQIPGFSAGDINGAWRVIKVAGKLQLHVFEFAKVFMVMYIAWAMDMVDSGRQGLVDKIADMKRLQKHFPRLSQFLKTRGGRVMFYVGLPILVVSGLIFPGSNSSAAIVAGILILTAAVAGLEKKYLLYIGIGIVAICVVAFAGYKMGLLPAQRVETAISRIFMKSTDTLLAEMHTMKPGSPQFQKFLDANKQRISAKVAVSEGTGLLGKGPGNSTQKYVVSVIYEDYIFSFIIEEYGILGALFIMFIYGSLLARGSMLVRQCEDRYARALIAGLIILISGQALLHMMVNLDMRIHTGQTLPMISHGKSAFIAFSIAFGIILSVSRMANMKHSQETEKADNEEAQPEEQ